MSQQHNKQKGASLHTTLVYEEDGQFCQYAGAGRQPVAVFDRERAVLESARRVGQLTDAESIRVVFIIPTQTDHPPTPHTPETSATKR
jgi:hypothetical protein